MPQLQAILFDVDGTLAETERDGHRVAFNRAFAEQGLDWDWSVEVYGKLLSVTGGKERIRHYLVDYLGDPDPDRAAGQFIRTLHERKTAHYLAMLLAGTIPLRPGVARLLDEAKAAGLRLGIATTTTPDNVTYLLQATLGKTGPARFDVIAAGDIVAAKKPAPAIYDYALDRLGLTAADCLAIEDSDNGLQAAQGAGLPTLVVTNDYTRGQDFTGAAAVLDGFGTPEQPCTAVYGPPPPTGQVDVAWLRQLWQRAVG